MVQTGTVEWPYEIGYGEVKEDSTDVLILGGGIAGCWAAIAAANAGVRVTIMEKSATIGSGAGGAGCDHWGSAITHNPLCPLTAEEFVEASLDTSGGYRNAISDYICAKDSYQTLLEMEEMGGKIRDTNDEFEGAEFRDEKSKLLFAYDYTNRYMVRVWGTTFKPALYKECKRLGIKIYDRVMATGLLTTGGKPGARVVGATGMNVRTGEMVVLKAKATVMCTAKPGKIWHSPTEETALSYAGPTFGGATMAWRAGADFTLMEKSAQAGVLIVAPCQGAAHPGNTWFACSMVDAEGKAIPWIDRDGIILKDISQRYRPVDGQKFIFPPYHLAGYDHKSPINISIEELVENGELTLPLYADLPSMPEHERRVIFGLMVGQESKSGPTYKYYTEAGFDPDKDMLQGYQLIAPYAYGISGVGRATPGYQSPLGSRNVRTFTNGGLVIDWDMKTNLKGLYAAGYSIFDGAGHPAAATTGKHAGKKAAEYSLKAAEPKISPAQVEDEKARIYAPVKRRDGFEWKELNNGINKIMQVYCGDPKNAALLDIGLTLLDDLKREASENLIASDPHKLSRALETMDILTSAEMVIHACLGRKASSKYLGFKRWDFPESDPAKWHKFVTIRQEKGRVKFGELPIGYWGSLEDNYQKHCSGKK